MPATNGLRVAVNVPYRGDPERKKALNVLAQRRYRQRKRERLLASQAITSTSPSGPSQEPTSPALAAPPTPDESSGSQHVSSLPFGTHAFEPTSQLEFNTGALADAVRLSEWSPMMDSCASGMDADGELSLWQPNDAVYEGATFTDFGPALFPSDAALGQELQSLESSQFTFPDDTGLEVPALSVLRAGVTIAQLLGCEHSLWDPNASGVLELGQTPLPTLPASLEPTEAQKRIPHHPMLDILPWPSVRTKLICVFALPQQVRPPAARDPLALAQMMSDMDDDAEGFRVSGGGSFNVADWEVGQAFFRNWWWALDRSVIDRSNALRAKRGAGRLQLLPA